MVDLVLLGALAGFARAGWSSGFVRRLFGLIFIVVGFVAATYLRTPVGSIVHGILPKVPTEYAEAIGYSIAFSAVAIGLNLVSGLFLSRVPKHGLAHRTDQLLGVAFGLAEAAILMSAGIVILHSYSNASVLPGGLSELVPTLNGIRKAVDNSTIAQLLEKTTVPIVLVLLGPFLPTDLKSILPTQIPGGLPFSPTDNH